MSVPVPDSVPLNPGLIQATRSALHQFYGQAAKPDVLYYPEGMEWLDKALCQHLDPDIFFVSKGRAATEAKAICRCCPALKKCRTYALANPVQGVWAGMTDRERKEVRKELGIEVGRSSSGGSNMRGSSTNGGPG